MPELPEVETIRRGLSKFLIGRRIVKVSVFDSPKSFSNSLAQVEQFLYGAEVVEVRRRAKVLIIDLSSKYSLVIHLKMTGQLVFRRKQAAGPAARSAPENFSVELKTFSGAAPPRVTRSDSEKAESDGFAGGHPTDSLIGQLPDRSTRVEIKFDDGSKLFFNDQRKFGWIKLVPTIEVAEMPFMQKVGPEPLDPATTSEDFVQRIRRRKGSMIKPALLDQSVIAGVGNIYADESLWAAQIHPEVRVRDVTDQQLELLFEELKKILKISIDAGGSTDKNYVDAEGRKGSYLEFARVFRREHQACHRHPDVLIEKTKVAGRGTHTCSVCQEKPR